jgi:hypothetical protein
VIDGAVRQLHYLASSSHLPSHVYAAAQKFRTSGAILAELAVSPAAANANVAAIQPIHGLANRRFAIRSSGPQHDHHHDRYHAARSAIEISGEEMWRDRPQDAPIARLLDH